MEQYLVGACSRVKNQHTLFAYGKYERKFVLVEARYREHHPYTWVGMKLVLNLPLHGPIDGEKHLV